MYAGCEFGSVSLLHFPWKAVTKTTVVSGHGKCPKFGMMVSGQMMEYEPIYENVVPDVGPLNLRLAPLLHYSL